MTLTPVLACSRSQPSTVERGTLFKSWTFLTSSRGPWISCFLPTNCAQLPHTHSGIKMSNASCSVSLDVNNLWARLTHFELCASVFPTALTAKINGHSQSAFHMQISCLPHFNGRWNVDPCDVSALRPHLIGERILYANEMDTPTLATPEVQWRSRAQIMRWRGPGCEPGAVCSTRSACNSQESVPTGKSEAQQLRTLPVLRVSVNTQTSTCTHTRLFPSRRYNVMSCQFDVLA